VFSQLVGRPYTSNPGIVPSVSLTDRALALIPPPLRSLLLKRREVVKFAVVGGICYVITVVINYGLKLTVLTAKPVTALTIATVIASIVSYLLNREWSFSTRGGRRRHHEASLFFLFSAVAVGLTSLPLFVSRYVFELRTPNVSRPVQEIADFVSGLILGTVLGMIFRLWSFRRWVFPHENVRPGRAERDRARMAASLVGAASDASAAGGNGRVNGHALPSDITVPITPAPESTGPP
jgi:putative flippase GtrA